MMKIDPKKNIKDMTGEEFLALAGVMGINPRHEAVRMPLWFGETIEAEQTKPLACVLQIVFKPQILMVDPLCAADCRLADFGVCVGNMLQSANILPNEGVSCTLLPPVSDPEHAKFLNWEISTIHVGQKFLLNVRNASKKPVYFSAIFWGLASIP